MATIAKIAVAFAVILVLSLGLCGIAVFAGSRAPGAMGGIALGGMVLGIAGLLLCGVAGIIVAIVNAVRGDGPKPPPLQ